MYQGLIMFHQALNILRPGGKNEIKSELQHIKQYFNNYFLYTLQ